MLAGVAERERADGDVRWRGRRRLEHGHRRPAMGLDAAGRGSDGWDDEYLGKVYDAEVVRRILPYLKPYKMQAALAFTCMIVSAVTSFLQPLLIGLTVKAGVQGDTDRVWWLPRDHGRRCRSLAWLLCLHPVADHVVDGQPAAPPASERDVRPHAGPLAQLLRRDGSRPHDQPAHERRHRHAGAADQWLADLPGRLRRPRDHRRSPARSSTGSSPSLPSRSSRRWC